MTHRESILALIKILAAHSEWRDALLIYVPPSTLQKLLRIAQEFNAWAQNGIERDGATTPDSKELFAAGTAKILLYPSFTPPKNESTGYLRSTLIALAEADPQYTPPPAELTPAQKERERLFAQVIAERLATFRACKIDLSRFQKDFEHALRHDPEHLEAVEYTIIEHCKIQEAADRLCSSLLSSTRAERCCTMVYFSSGGLI